MHARPVPLDPYNPLPPSPTPYSSASLSDSADEIRHPHPLIPIRIPIFALVLWLNDWVVRFLSLGGGRGRNDGPVVGRGGPGLRHRRVRSNSVESVEEGEGFDLGMIGAGGLRSPPASGMSRMRVGVGASQKIVPSTESSSYTRGKHD